MIQTFLVLQVGRGSGLLERRIEIAEVLREGVMKAVTPASQAGTRFTYPGGMEDWVDLGDQLYAEIVCRPSKYLKGKRVKVLYSR